MGGGVRVGRVDRLKPRHFQLVWFPEVDIGWKDNYILLSEVVTEVGDGVVGVANKESLSLTTVVLVAVNVGENSRDLSVYQRQTC